MFVSSLELDEEIAVARANKKLRPMGVPKLGNKKLLDMVTNYTPKKPKSIWRSFKMTPRHETEVLDTDSDFQGETFDKVRASLTAVGGQRPSKKLMAETESVIKSPLFNGTSFFGSQGQSKVKDLLRSRNSDRKTTPLSGVCDFNKATLLQKNEPFKMFGQGQFRTQSTNMVNKSSIFLRRS